MRGTLPIILAVLAFQSCESIHFRTTRRDRPVPKSFDDSVASVLLRLERCANCDYYIYKEKLGNCFGGSLHAFARIISYDGTRFQCRDIEAKQDKVVDKTNDKDYTELFNYFSKNKIDMVLTIPKPGISMEPASRFNVSARIASKKYEKTFEMTPFYSTKDTTHPLYVLVKKANQ